MEHPGFSNRRAPAACTIKPRLADWYKVKKPDTLASALEKLAGRNLSDPNLSRLVEALFHTYPPIARRIAYIRESALRHE